MRREAGARAAAGRGDVGGGGVRCLVGRGDALQADGGCGGRGGDSVAEEPGLVEGVAVPAGEELGVGCHRDVFSLRRVALPYRTVLHRTVLYCIVPYCNALPYRVVPCRIVP